MITHGQASSASGYGPRDDSNRSRPGSAVRTAGDPRGLEPFSAMLRQPRAVVFDLDGVLVDTARLHARAWKATFDSLFDELGIEGEFDEVEDYRRYVDGRPRYGGVAALLRSREIDLPPGAPQDAPGFSTEAAVGNLKNRLFHELVESEGVEVLPGAGDLVESLAASGVPMAIVSSSRNVSRVLPDHLGRHFSVVLGGSDVAELGIPGKPEPGMFIEGARRLGAEPNEAAVVEDATAGVLAGRHGGFAVVVGIDPVGSLGLKRAGADFVVAGVDALPRDIGDWGGLIEPPKDALGDIDQIIDRLLGRPAIFLDYDGTLTPIVDDPAAATIGGREREVLRELAEMVPVTILSGRGLDDVKSLVAVDGLTYSGSHGYEIERPDGSRSEQGAAADAVPQLDEAEELLVVGVTRLPGVMIERKPYAIAVHTRRAETQAAREGAGDLAREVVSRFDRLSLRGGKEIHELRPALDWDKGAALSHLLGLIEGNPVPIYIGDDETDEDGFLAVRKLSGVGVRVGAALGSETWADFVLDEPGEVLDLLSTLARALRKGLSGEGG